MNITNNNNTLLLSSTIDVGFKYIHSVIKVNIEDEELVFESITDSESSFVLSTDGYYKITEIKLPTTTGGGYYISGETIYNPSSQVILVEDLLLVDPIGTNIIRTDYNHIFIYFLNKYYTDLLNSQLLKQLKCGCQSVNKTDKTTIDILTMGLILIEKLIENLMFYEANRIIYKLSLCSNMVNYPNCNCNA